MSDFLAQMAASSRERADRIGTFSSGDFDRPVTALDLGIFDIIAEIKGRSPAEGALNESNRDRVTQARAYVDGGAAAISVLTEPSRFDGDLAHLDELAAALPGTAIMRKDFLVDRNQVLEARSAGASGVLLIAAMLDDATLDDMLDCAFEHGMFVLLEAFDRADLERCFRVWEREMLRAADGQLLVGINTRDLRTLEVDNDRLDALAAFLPGARGVAESGLKTPADVARVAGLGFQLALVGSALMRSDDPAQLLRDMRQSGSEVLAA